MTATWIKRLNIAGLFATLATIILAVLWAFPILRSFSNTIVPQALEGNLLASYQFVLLNTDLGRWYLNSLVTSSGVTFLVLAISASCGYAISQINFTGRKLLWAIVLASFMIPVQALIVNHFFLIYHWGLYNSWLGVILPQVIAPVAVIVYKQFFDSVPFEISEAAKMDNASHWQIFWRIYLPMNWGVTSALGIIIFIGAWNAFLWPFLAVTRPELMNVTVGINQLWDYGVSGFAGALLAALPVAIVYLIFQRKVTQAVVLTAGLKG